MRRARSFIVLLAVVCVFPLLGGAKSEEKSKTASSEAVKVGDVCYK